MLEASPKQPGLPVQEAWREVERWREEGWRGRTLGEEGQSQGEGGPGEKEGRGGERKNLEKKRRGRAWGEGGVGERQGQRGSRGQGWKGRPWGVGGERGKEGRGPRSLAKKAVLKKNVRKLLMEKTPRFSYANCGLAKLRVQKRNLSWGVMGARAESPATEGSGGGAHSI